MLPLSDQDAEGEDVGYGEQAERERQWHIPRARKQMSGCPGPGQLEGNGVTDSSTRFLPG